MKKVILVGLMFVGFVSFSQNKPTTYKLGKSVVMLGCIGSFLIIGIQEQAILM